MAGVVWTPVAESDLDDILFYISVVDRRPVNESTTRFATESQNTLPRNFPAGGTHTLLRTGLKTHCFWGVLPLVFEVDSVPKRTSSSGLWPASPPRVRRGMSRHGAEPKRDNVWRRPASRFQRTGSLPLLQSDWARGVVFSHDTIST